MPPASPASSPQNPYQSSREVAADAPPVELPERTSRDREILLAAQKKGSLATLGAWISLSGPGWLQSAITLGGGSLATSMFLGSVAGFSMLWVQPLAMILGIVMLSAIAYITTTTGEKPFGQISRHINPMLAWGWLLGALAANMVWSMPQYALAVGAIKDNLLPPGVGPTAGSEMDLVWKVGLTAIIFIFCLAITWSYESGRRGIKIYEAVLKTMIAGIVICFFGVGIALSARGEIDWAAVAWGFIPDPSALFRPSRSFDHLLAAVPDANRGYWTDLIVSKQRDFILGAAATAVGINMTFLFPYSMLKKGWTKEFRGLAVFDLTTGMLIPFTLATSFVIMAAATQFHPTPGRIDAVEIFNPDEPQASSVKTLAADSAAEHETAIAGVVQGGSVTLTSEELALAWHLERRNTKQLSQALSPLVGNQVAFVVFGIGVLGMALSTITLLMLISGFCFCEAFGLPSEGWPHRLGCLLSATGILGPFLGLSDAYVAIPTSVFGMMLIPLAYLSFVLMMNSKRILGRERPRGAARVIWNVLMVTATVAALGSSFVAIYSKIGWLSLWVYGVLGVLLVIGFVMPRPSEPAVEGIRPQDAGPTTA